MNDIIQTRMLGYIQKSGDPWGILKTGRLEDRSQYIMEAFDKCDSVLDLGGGFGIYSDFLKNLGKKVVCFDMSERMVTEGKSKFPTLEFIRGDACNLPFKPGSFEGVLCMGMIMYVENKGHMLSEINRVLIDNGKFCCIERNKLSPEHMFSAYTGLFTSAVGEYFRFPTIFSLKKLLRKNNFKINTMKGDFIALPFKMNKTLFALSQKIGNKLPVISYFIIVNSQKIGSK